MIQEPDPAGIQKAVELLRSGHPIGFPTETVYGLAADGMNPAAIARVFEIKQRPEFDPLIYHISDQNWLEDLALEIPPAAKDLMEIFWPGALTLIFPKKPEVPDLATSGMPTVAVRCPEHPVARQVLDSFGGPLVAPSANLFGRISPTTAEAVVEELGDSVNLVLDGGACERGLESTILDVRGERPVLLRPGAVTMDELLALTGEVVRYEGQADGRAPGMLESHYAPRTPLQLVERGQWGAANDTSAAYLFWSDPGQEMEATHRVLSPTGNAMEAAVHFFSYLRELDGSGATIIYAEQPPEEGLGLAIADRLKRAAA
jgi:L-threonylcarbamoyladenylate synthase